MIRLSPEAAAQIEMFEQFSFERQKPQAIRNLAHALAEASLIPSNPPEWGLSAPRPHPDLETHGFLLIKPGRYWIVYDFRTTVTAGVLFDTDDIPGLLE